MSDQPPRVGSRGFFSSMFHLFSKDADPPPPTQEETDGDSAAASTAAATAEEGSQTAAASAASRQRAPSGVSSEFDVTEVMPAGSPAPGTPASVFPTAGSLLRESPTRRVDCYGEPDATEFLVRSKRYLSDRRKVSSPPALCALVAADLLQCGRKIDVASALVGSVPKLTPSREFVVFNWQVPSTPALSLVCYFVMPQTHVPRPGDHSGMALLRRFLSRDESDEFRNVRFKLIPRINEGPWIVKRAVGNVPAIIGNKLTTTYHWGENWTEITIDVGSSVAASAIFSIVRSYVRSLVIDLGIVIQGNTEDELPEHILGAIRIIHFSLGGDHIRVIPDD